ncbi:hypothetical protein BGZ79_008159 [Entomortierella chlamydospora]|nr:hypothetical protein BGZ79_008159 [Entomortierella chlamydospora]
MSIQSTEGNPPAVLIAGAGLGGLMLAILFERINIPYHIFERAKELHQLGGVMTLGASILPVFEQLGLLEEIMKMSKIFEALELHHPDTNEKATLDRTFLKEAVGYHSILFARPNLYELLLSQVPAEKISLNKKVLHIKESEDRVAIHCSDGTTYEGDILIGADGAYSGVRQSLYKSLDEQGLLPKTDLDGFSIGYTIMVGIADPKEPEKYPALNGPSSRFPIVIGGNYKTWAAVCTPGNKICWTLANQISEEEAIAQHFRNSEWGPEANEAMIKEFEDHVCTLGGTMGDIIKDTPRDRISKVFLEEKVFKTWYHGRTVLVGDAVHKLQPAGGLGACNTFQDTVVLVNYLHEMKDTSLKSITAAYKKYYNDRYYRVQEQFERSHSVARLFFGQTWTERMMRLFMFKCVPTLLMNRAVAKSLEYHPVISWLPPATTSNSEAVSYQGSTNEDQ